MRHSYWLATMAAMTLTGAVALADMETGRKFEPAKTRQEAIAKVKERLVKLEKMTDQEWAEKNKKREERRKEWRERRNDRKMEKGAAAPAAPAATAKPVAAPAPEKK